MNRYETVFILTPVLSEDQAKEAVKEYQKFLENNEAKVMHEEHWGLRKLAYQIKKKSTGFYHLFEYEAEGDLINKLETDFRRDERVLRFLTTRLDKHAITYVESRKNRNKKEEVA
jgi:small subunit ribosomal protein S6